MKTLNKKQKSRTLSADRCLCLHPLQRMPERRTKTEPETTKISETTATDAEKTAETVNADVPSPTIPTTIKESEELFGKIDKVTGKWIPPEDSYTDPKTGNIINKEGVVIGIAPGYTPKPNPNAVG